MFSPSLENSVIHRSCWLEGNLHIDYHNRPSPGIPAATFLDTWVSICRPLGRELAAAGTTTPFLDSTHFWGGSCTVPQCKSLGFGACFMILPSSPSPPPCYYGFITRSYGTLIQIFPHYNVLQRKHLGWTEAQSRMMKEYSFLTH